MSPANLDQKFQIKPALTLLGLRSPTVSHLKAEWAHIPIFCRCLLLYNSQVSPEPSLPNSSTSPPPKAPELGEQLLAL